MKVVFSRRAARFSLIGLLGVLFVAGCAQPVPPAPRLELTYTHLPPIRLDVGAVEIVENYVPPLREPNIEHLIPVSPAEAARHWALDRLQATGGDRRAQFVIEKAEVVQNRLPVEKGIRGALTVDQETRVDALLSVTLEIRDERGFRLAFASAQAARSETLSENLTLRERDMIYFRMVEELMNDLNGELEAKIAEFLTPYIR